MGQTQYFARFSEDKLHFSWQVQHFGDLHHDFGWQRQHFGRVLLCGLRESHCQGCVKWWQSANRVASVGHCESVIFAWPGQYLVRSVVARYFTWQEQCLGHSAL